MTQPSRWPLHSGWVAQRVSDTPFDGAKISNPATALTGWLDAIVPGTVLTTLCAALPGQYPDPYYGTQSQSIPDASQPGGMDAYTFWFATDVTIPQLSTGQQAWIHFRGINEAAEVFFNGVQLNDATLRGMFLRHSFNVTSLARTKNRVAVRVKPPDPPGVPGGNGGKAPNIGNSVTMRYSVGWDWVIPIPDRNTGIWDEVLVEITGPVTIGDPHVVTTVLDAKGALRDYATVAVSTEITNSSVQAVTCTLSCEIDGKTLSAEVAIAPGTVNNVAFTPLRIDRPRLWWPNGYAADVSAAQPLYPLTLRASVNGAVSQERSLNVGIRQVTVKIVDVEGNRTSRAFHVNGERIFLRGGNWIGTDAMLRLSRQRYEDEVRLHAMTGLNFIRVWGGGIAERPEFYEACDRYGMLVMQDFWLSGEYEYGYPPEYDDIFLACASDTIQLLRNHPSLLFWCGANESRPGGKLKDGLPALVETVDGTRPYIYMSTNISGSTDDQYLDGPYGCLEPEMFFDRTLSGWLKDTPFNPELGSVGMPVIESMLAMMPESDARDLPQMNDVPGLECNQKRRNADWWHHSYGLYCLDVSGTGQDFITPYMDVKRLEDFCAVAQMVNYTQYKALVEGYTQQGWSDAPGELPVATGFLIWKSQNPWPGLRGSLYDWWLDQNGGYFGVKQATQPVHAQLDLQTREIVLVNTTRQPRTVSFTATIYDLAGNKGVALGGAANVPAMSFHRAGAAPGPGGAPVWFLRLDVGGSPSNFYWLHAPGGDYRKLTSMAGTSVGASGSARIENGRCTASIQLANTGQPVAFFLRLQVLDASGKNRVLPVFYSDNYLSLIRAERREIQLDFAFPGAGRPQFWLEGSNTKRQQVPVTFT